MVKEVKRDPLGVAICEALNIDPNITRRFMLNIAAGEPPRLQVEQYLESDKDGGDYRRSIDGILTTLKEYKLVPLEEGDDNA